MERTFLEPEQAERLKIFAQVMSIKGQMRRFTDDRWILMQMALCNIIEQPVPPNAKHNIIFFGNTTWCYLAVRHLGNADPHENGLCCLRIDRKYLLNEFAPHNRPDKSRMKKIVNSLLAILNVNPSDVDLDHLSMFGFGTG